MVGHLRDWLPLLLLLVVQLSAPVGDGFPFLEAALQAAAHIFEASDREQAMQNIQHGRDMAHRCDALITRIGRGGYDGETTTALVLATRFYKRIGGHVMNILSSVVMPLHKIDYYDEDELAGSPE